MLLELAVGDAYEAGFEYVLELAPEHWRSIQLCSASPPCYTSWSIYR
jgi:hypothetical protein